MTAFNDFLQSFDGDSSKRGKQFEHFVKWFLKNDPEAAKIYKWLIRQRVKYKAGKLTDTQIQLMESSIKEWEWSPKRGKKVKK